MSDSSPRHRTAAVLLGLGVGLVVLVTSALPGAQASPRATGATGISASYAVSSPRASSSGRRGAATVARAATALHGYGPRLPGATDPADATMLLRSVFLARPRLHGSDADLAAHLLARPTDGTADPYGDGYRVPARRLCGPHLCVHWVSRGTDRATPHWVRVTLRTMEQVWRHHIDELGYRAPPTDGRRGGNAKFDVYLKELGNQGLYGYCAPERKVPGEPAAASSYCVLDNDFARVEYHTAPIAALRVTAAHEFFHAIQFGYDYHEDRWILEATATWMERQFAPGIDDNRRFLPYGQVGLPSEPLDTFSAAGYNEYGNWAFFQYLSQRFGQDIVRRIWQHLGDGVHREDYSIQGVRAVLRHHGGLPRVYAAFVGANLAPDTAYGPVARLLPATQIAASHPLSALSPRWTWTTRVRHLAARDVSVIPAPGLAGRWRLRLTVHGPPRGDAPAAYLTLRTGDHHVVRRAFRLTQRGRGRVTVPFDATTTSATVSLVNASTRYRCGQHSRFSCGGRPLEDHEAFGLDAVLLAARHRG